MKSIVSLANVPKFYRGLSHQKRAINYLGKLLIGTPMGSHYQVSTPHDWLALKPHQLDHLQQQITAPTLQTFTAIWRSNIIAEDPQLFDNLPMFSQLDNDPVNGKQIAYVSCNSSTHAMMLKSLQPDSLSDDMEYVRRVYKGEFGRSKHRNPSIFWDVHVRGLAAYGIKIRTNSLGHWKKALIQCNKGIITPVNIRHKGHINKQYGGHVVGLAPGSNSVKLQIRDPFGELNYISGVYDTKVDGIYEVSAQRFLARWQGTFSEYMGVVG